MCEIEELRETKRNLENEIENFFGKGQKYEGDENYQDLLNRLSDIEDEIEELLKL